MHLATLALLAVSYVSQNSDRVKLSQLTRKWICRILFVFISSVLVVGSGPTRAERVCKASIWLWYASPEESMGTITCSDADFENVRGTASSSTLPASYSSTWSCSNASMSCTATRRPVAAAELGRLCT